MSNFEKINVLIVEDNEDDLFFIKKALSDESYNLHEIVSGTDAFNYLLKPKIVPDIVLLDNHLPGMNGVEILEKLGEKKNDYGFIFLTVDKTIETVVKAMKAGTLDFIVKSAKIKDELSQKIERVYEIHRNKIEKLESEANFQSLIESGNDAIWSIDKNYRYIVFNQFFKNSYKTAYNFELRKGINAVEILPEESKKIWKPKYDAVLSGERLVFELNVEINNEQQYYEVRLNPIILGDNIVGVSAISRNITSRKKNEIKLKEQNEELIKAKEKAEESEEKYRNLFERNFDAIFIYDPNTTNILEANEATSKIYGYDKDELIGMSCLKLSAELEDSASTIDRIHEDDEINVPHRLHRKKDGTVFSVDISSYAITLAGKKVMFAVSKDITERKQTEDKLRNAKANLKNTFDISPGLICVANANTGYFTECNQAVTRILGISVEEFMSRPFIEFVHPKDRQRTVNEITKQMKGSRIVSFENRYRCKDGSYKWLAWQATGAGKNGKVYAVATDVTEHKQAEEALRESEKLNISITQTAADAIISINSDGIILSWNNAAEKIFGYSSSEMMNKNLSGIIPAKYQADHHVSLKRLKNDGSEKLFGKKIEITALRKDGTEFPIDLSVSSWETDNQKCYTGIIRDITERKRVEGALQKSEERMRTMFEKAPLGIALIDSQTGQIFEVNPRFAEIVGRSKEEMGKIDWMRVTHPDDVQKDLDNMAQLNAGKITGFNMNKQYIQPDGSVVWINMTIAPIKFEDDSQARHLCMIEDITKRKKAEENLKKQNLEYATLHEKYKAANEKLFTAKRKAEESEKTTRRLLQKLDLHVKQTPLAVIDWDLKFRVSSWNKAAEKIFGFSQKEAIGKHPGEIILPSHLREQVNKVWSDLIKNKRGNRNLIENITKDGNIITCDWHNTPLVNEQNKVISVTSLVLDITEQKNAEIQQRERIKELNGLYSFLKEAGSTVNLKELLEKLTAEIIPQSMQFPDKVFSEIIINKYIYTNCKNISNKTDHYLKSNITYKKKKVGELHIGYIDKKIKFIEKYAQNLTNAYAFALGKIIENYNFYEKLIKAKEKAEAANEKVKESEEKYRSLFENMKDSFALSKIILDENKNPVDYVFIEVNKMFETQTGRKKEEIINQKATEVVTGIENDPTDWIGIYGKVALTGEEIRFEQFSKHLGRWYSVLAFSTKKGYFATIFNDITERKEMDKALLKAILETEEKERSRIAKDLHDGLGPILSTIKLYNQWIKKPDKKTSKEYILDKSMDAIEEAIKSLKEISNNLSPHILTNYGIAPAIKSFVEKLNILEEIEIVFETNLSEKLKEPIIETTLYRIFTECINNTIKYAKADKVYISLKQYEDKIEMKYSDNGIGFDVDKELKNPSGSGLNNIINRVKTINGQCNITSNKKSGTKISIKL